MIREIKFRGLCTRRNIYVYGYLSNKDVINTDKGRLKVIPESVGQFTGLKDKNGVEIYEGDLFILRGHECCVYYRRGYCDFVFKYIKYGGRNLNVTKANITKYGLEVIGNIHEIKKHGYKF